MKRTNERNFKIGDRNLSIVAVKSDYCVLAITGRENGFKTVFKLNRRQASELYNAICNGIVHSSHNFNHRIYDVVAKNRTYTCDNTSDVFTYKYNESKDCIIEVITLGGHCIVSLYSPERCYRTVSFQADQVIKTIDHLAKALDEIAMTEF